MGLAPYGDINSPQTKEFINKIERELIEIKSDGSIFLNPRFFRYSTSLKMINKKSWEKLFDIKLRIPEEQITDSHCNLAIAIQVLTEKIVFLMAQEAKKITNSDYLCLAGGVALNCVSNGRLIRSNLFKDIFIQPASGDSGGSLGAALAIKYLYYNDNRSVLNEPPIFNSAYLGPEYFKNDIEILNRKTKSVFHYYENEDDLIRIVVNELVKKKAVGWFQGRMEFGPRALGNRSILADPRDAEMIDKLNIKIKNRENFRPFAPVMLEEEASLFYDICKPSPYMMFTSELKNENKNLSNQTHTSFADKLNFSRSKIPAVTHVDFSSRIQTVNEKQNKRLFKLLKAFKKETDIGVLVNTSFNERGEPIVCSPSDAYNCFINTEMDVLVLENYIYFKSEQTAKDITKNNFKLD
jgi:carbamoyltransferase